MSEKAYFGTPRDMPTEVTLPGRVDSTTHEETMGEFGTRLFLFQHTKDHTAAVAAAAGWDGDRYRIVRAGKGRGVVWVTVWDSAVDAAEFVDAVGDAIGRRYRRHQLGALVFWFQYMCNASQSASPRLRPLHEMERTNPSSAPSSSDGLKSRLSTVSRTFGLHAAS